MAFALMNVFEPPIVKIIYDYALIEPTEAHVIFFNHITEPAQEYHITLPSERATIRELQEAMSELHQFKRWSWFPEEFHFFEDAATRMRRKNWIQTSTPTSTGFCVSGCGKP